MADEQPWALDFKSFGWISADQQGDRPFVDSCVAVPLRS